MTINEIIEQAQTLSGVSVPEETLLRWVSDLDGRLAIDYFGVDGWIAPYDSDDLDVPALIEPPWDEGIYVPYLEAMTYYTTGEYDRYENAKAMYEAKLLEFKKYLNRSRRVCCCRPRRLEINSVRLEDPLNVGHHY